MRKTAKFLTTASAVLMLLGTAALPTVATAADDELVAKGKKIAENRKKGNCFTCHAYKGAHLAGNIGPSLDGIGKRKTKKQLFDQIWDATAVNPNSSMPPFGKYEALSKAEVTALAEWASTL